MSSVELLASACRALSEVLAEITCSSLYMSKAMYVEDQADFYNMAVKGFVSDSADPFLLLKAVNKIEAEYGRDRSKEIRFGPRPLDIDIEEFGTSSYRIKSHPTWLPKNNTEKVLRTIIEQVIKEENNFNLSKFNDHLAATMACKASIKGNTRITINDMESIINQLRECNNPFNCPHGRPTIIEFTIYELEKMFKRSI